MELHADDIRQMERQARQQHIITIENGMKGIYWKLLKKKLESLILVAEKRRVDLLDAGINEKTLRALNDEKVRMETYAQILKINEAIIYDNKTWLDRFKEPVKKVFEYVSAFVGYGRNPDVQEQDGNQK